jgi:hypothetical protein
LGVEEDGDGLGGASARSTRGEGREGGEVRGGGRERRGRRKETNEVELSGNR